MRLVLRFIFKLLALWLILCAERVIGLPVFFLILSWMWARQYRVVARYLWLVLLSLLWMSIFQISWTLAFVLLVGGSWWLRRGRGVMASDTIRLIVSTIVSCIIINWVMPGTIAIGGWVYLFLSLLAALILLKKERLKFTPEWRMYEPS